MFDPDAGDGVDVSHEPGRAVGGGDEEGRGYIMELSRTPLKLIWSIQEDAFARYFSYQILVRPEL